MKPKSECFGTAAPPNLESPKNDANKNDRITSPDPTGRFERAPIHPPQPARNLNPRTLD
jgi:hypothetical protein